MSYWVKSEPLPYNYALDKDDLLTAVADVTACSAQLLRIK